MATDNPFCVQAQGFLPGSLGPVAGIRLAWEPELWGCPTTASQSEGRVGSGSFSQHCKVREVKLTQNCPPSAGASHQVMPEEVRQVIRSEFGAHGEIKTRGYKVVCGRW